MLLLSRPNSQCQGSGRDPPRRAQRGSGRRGLVTHRPRSVWAIAIDDALTTLSIQLVQVMLPVLFVAELGYSAESLGLFFAIGGIGVVTGALAARRIGNVVGYGRALWIIAILIAPFGFLIPLAGDQIPAWAAAGGWFVVMLKVGVDNVLKVSLRQRVTPDRMLGRMAATMRFMLTGALAIGAALAGVLGEYAGVRAALWAGAVGLAIAWIPIILSPLRTIRTLSEAGR